MKGRLRGVLIVAQVAVSLVLLVGAGLMLRSLLKLQHVDPGFAADNVLTMSIDLTWTRYSTPEKRLPFFQSLVNELRALPGVKSVGVSGT